ncbi:hypothetical protein B5G43_06595 [Flavonifractor sp. An92]|nr:hypothetical protein B5G43_06595 [Flavonifractor sp. An92]
MERADLLLLGSGPGAAVGDRTGASHPRRGDAGPPEGPACAQRPGGGPLSGGGRDGVRRGGLLPVGRALLQPLFPLRGAAGPPQSGDGRPGRGGISAPLLLV